ncbi:MAG: hypothetical protein F6K56_22760 [Moorea sp. SIO3G5]|nr:hypothetical protein [Moorena sp. SIO3G5]
MSSALPDKALRASPKFSQGQRLALEPQLRRYLKYDLPKKLGLKPVLIGRLYFSAKT